MDYSKVDEETREKLSALGYVGSFTDPAKLKGQTLANPKEKIIIFNQLSQARVIGMNGKPDEAIRLIQEIIASDPDITDAYFSVGNILFQERKFEEAIENLDERVAGNPNNLIAWVFLAYLHTRLGHRNRAKKAARQVQRINPLFSVEEFAQRLTFKSEAGRERFREYSKRAGLNA